jgi:hypothetical protein
MRTFHTNPKRKRGNVFTSSLTLRVSVPVAAGSIMVMPRDRSVNLPLDEKGLFVPRRSESPKRTRQLQRFRSDYRSRYSSKLSEEALAPPVELAMAEEIEGNEQARLPSLPPEIGILLTMVGTAGVVLPGMIGTPFLVAGGIALWPSGFRKVERWLLKVSPKAYETGVQQIEIFLADLERRYPGSTR